MFLYHLSTLLHHLCIQTATLCNSVQFCAIMQNTTNDPPAPGYCYGSQLNKSKMCLSKFQPMERSIIQLVLHRTVSVGSQSSAVVLHRGAISDPAASFGHGQLQPEPLCTWSCQVWQMKLFRLMSNWCWAPASQLNQISRLVPARHLNMI